MENILRCYNTDKAKTFLTTVEVVFQEKKYRGVFTYTWKIHGVIDLPGADYIVQDIVCGNMKTAELTSVNGAEISYDKVTEEFYLKLVDDENKIRKYDELYEDDIKDMIVSIRIIRQKEVQ